MSTTTTPSAAPLSRGAHATGATVAAGGSYVLTRWKDATAYPILAMFSVLIVITGMWLLNISGLMSLNIIPFIIGGIFILGFGIHPYSIMAGAGIGVLKALFEDTDLSQGVSAGVKNITYRVFTAMLFSFWLSGGLLATWSFASSPVTFWVIASMLLLVTVASLHFKIKTTNWPFGLIVAYAVIVCGVYGFQTIPKSWMSTSEDEAVVRTDSMKQQSPIMLYVSPSEWTMLELPYRKCIFYRGVDPDGNAFQIQTRWINEKKWYSWDEYLRMKREYSLPSGKEFAYIRFKSNRQGQALVKYEFRPEGECY